MMEYIISVAVFLSIVLILVVILYLVETKIIAYKDCTIKINNDDDKTITTAGGTTLLSAFVNNKIMLPAACGGGGTCAMCKVCVKEGGGDILPTEEGHLSLIEQKEGIRLGCQVKVKKDMVVEVEDEIFGIEKFECEVVSNHNVSTFIKELKFKMDAHLAFKAGGYIQIEIPEYELSFKEMDIEKQYTPEWDEYKLWDLSVKNEEEIVRAYSMANYPEEKGMVLLNIRVATPPPGMENEVPSGIGSSYLFNLKPGDKCMLSGPYGEFFAKETDKEMCFIGGGAGMAPMRSHIFDQLKRLDTKREITYWYGARSAKEMFYDDEFKKLAEEHPNFTYNVCLSEPQPEDNWTGLTGFIHTAVQDEFLMKHEDPTEIEFYMCGPPMMNSSCLTMLDDMGIERDMIDLDEF